MGIRRGLMWPAACAAAGVVLHRLQTLILSSGSTTPTWQTAPSAGPAWCLTVREHSFVRKHHAPEPIRSAGGTGMVPHSPQTLIPSSGSTTPLSQNAPPTRPAWCLTALEPLFLRPEAPRLSSRMGLRRPGRGASPPASPYFFVHRHHAFRARWAFGGRDVVPRRPLALVSSSTGTTTLSQNAPSPRPAWCLTTR